MVYVYFVIYAFYYFVVFDTRCTGIIYIIVFRKIDKIIVIKFKNMVFKKVKDYDFCQLLSCLKYFAL